jgi:hypothetical protein
LISANTLGSASSTSVSKKPASGRLGEVISTGLDVTPITEWVVYGFSVHNMNAPNTTFGFALGERTNEGAITPDTEIMDASKPELAAGFHVPERAYTLEYGIEQPRFGYFVDTPARITGTVDGKTVLAERAVWSKNESVTVFGSTTPKSPATPS